MHWFYKWRCRVVSHTYQIQNPRILLFTTSYNHFLISSQPVKLMKRGQLMFTCSGSLCYILRMEYFTTDQCFPTHLLLQMLPPAVTTRHRHSLYCSTVNRESVLQQAGHRCTRKICTLLKCPWARYWILTSSGGAALCSFKRPLDHPRERNH